MKFLAIGLTCLTVFAVGLILGGVITETETIVETKTETITEVAELQNPLACDTLFEWYMSWPGEAFSDELDVMYEEYLDACDA